MDVGHTFLPRAFINFKEILFDTNYRHCLVYGICFNVACNGKYECSALWNSSFCYSIKYFRNISCLCNYQKIE